jgi:hypothetical protein
LLICRAEVGARAGAHESGLPVRVASPQEDGTSLCRSRRGWLQQLKAFVRGALILTVVLAVGFLASLLAGVFTRGAINCKCSEAMAAQANLQTAVKGADTFYTDNGSFSGIYGGSDISTITGIDVGLSFVAGKPSIGPNIISLAADPPAMARAGGIRHSGPRLLHRG